MSKVAERVIRKCGGPRAVAEMLGLGVPTVYKWGYPAERGGSNGLIPSAHHDNLLRRAREAGLDLRPEDFFNIDESPCVEALDTAETPSAAA